MNVFSNIWKDLKLMNATVYAQWLAILSAISIILVRIIWLVALGQSKPWVVGVVVVDMILMPLNILSVEMPLVFRWRWLAFGSMMWSLGRVLYGFVVNLPADLPGWVVFATMFRMAGTSYGLMLPFHNYFGRTRSSLGPLPSLLSGSEAENLYSVHVKAWYHLAYASTLIYGPRGPFHDVPRSAMSTLFRLGPLCASRLFCRMEPATLFSALASLSYWIALWAGQEYVFSRTLGGPGVERMTFIRPGRVSSNDSIGLDEGRIRL